MEEDRPYLMVMKGTQIIDVPIGQESTGSLSPIVGVENGRVLDFDKKKGDIFWIEGIGDNVSTWHIPKCIRTLETFPFYAFSASVSCVLI